MIPRNVAVGAGVLALAGLGAVAYYSSTARASQPASVAPATAVPGTYLDPVAAAPAVPPAQALAAPAGRRVVAAAPVHAAAVPATTFTSGPRSTAR